MATPRPRSFRQPRLDAQITFRAPTPRTLRERDEEALKLKQSFRAVSRGIERRAAPGRIWNRLKGWLGKTVAVVVLIAGAVYAGSLHTGWPVVMVLKHAASYSGCRAASSMGLAPARRGEPGYWRSHDGDQDGIACERWPRVRRSTPGLIRVH